MDNYHAIDRIFKRKLPNTLYLNHFELAEAYGYTPQEWRTYLRDNSAFIEAEMAAMIEPAARSAISRLGNATTSEVQALKALLEKSKLINDAQKQQTKIVMTFIPSTEPIQKQAPPPKQQSLAPTQEGHGLWD